MIYDYYHYNSPEQGNRNIYAYGDRYESLRACGFIHADTRAQAQTVLNANNRAWGGDCVLLPYTPEQCAAELERRKAERETA